MERTNLVDCRRIDIDKYVEDGIKSTVKVLISKGILTTSSCQGHLEGNEYRSVTIQIEDTQVPFFKKLIWEINQHVCSSIRFLVLDPGVFDLYSGIFQHPKKMMIIFGKCFDDTVEECQKAFNDKIRQIEMVDFIENNSLWDAFLLDSNNHTDCF